MSYNRKFHHITEYTFFFVIAYSLPLIMWGTHHTRTYESAEATEQISTLELAH